MERILQGDCREALQSLPDASVHMAVTSPPYWGLRDYGTEGQLGMERTPEEYVAKMVGVFREVRRVLRDDGTLWLNLGDSYYAAGWECRRRNKVGAGSLPPDQRASGKFARGLKVKDLVGIPWRVAFALQEDGWWLRQDIIWHKPNPMPESAKDRCTKAHEYLFLLSKSESYYFDPVAIADTAGKEDSTESENGGIRNRRSVWTVPTRVYRGAHFAVYPPELVEPCILAGTSERCCAVCGAPWVRKVERCRTPTRNVVRPKHAGETDRAKVGHRDPERHVTTVQSLGFFAPEGCAEDFGRSVVLDPFAGSGTTLAVAQRTGRDSIGIEINAEYCELMRERIAQQWLF